MDKKLALSLLEELNEQIAITKKNIESMEVKNKVLSDFYWKEFGFKFEDIYLSSKAASLRNLNKDLVKHIILIEQSNEAQW